MHRKLSQTQQGSTKNTLQGKDGGELIMKDIEVQNEILDAYKGDVYMHMSAIKKGKTLAELIYSPIKRCASFCGHRLEFEPVSCIKDVRFASNKYSSAVLGTMFDSLALNVGSQFTCSDNVNRQFSNLAFDMGCPTVNFQQANILSQVVDIRKQLANAKGKSGIDLANLYDSLAKCEGDYYAASANNFKPYVYTIYPEAKKDKIALLNKALVDLSRIKVSTVDVADIEDRSLFCFTKANLDNLAKDIAYQRRCIGERLKELKRLDAIARQ